MRSEVNGLGVHTWGSYFVPVPNYIVRNNSPKQSQLIPRVALCLKATFDIAKEERQVQ